MSLLKTIATTTGVACTLFATYKAQSYVGVRIRELNRDSGDVWLGKMFTAFGTAVVVGGVINSVLETVFESNQ